MSVPKMIDLAPHEWRRVGELPAMPPWRRVLCFVSGLGLIALGLAMTRVANAWPITTLGAIAWPALGVDLMVAALRAR